MKIAMIGHKRIPSREGGVEIVVEALSRRMVQRGHRVTVYNRKSRHVAGTAFDDHSHLHNLDGVQIRWVPTQTAKSSTPLCTAFLPRCGRCSVGTTSSTSTQRVRRLWCP